MLTPIMENKTHNCSWSAEIPGLPACLLPSGFLASPSLFHEVSFIYSYPRIITINENSHHLVVKLELVLKYSFFVVWAHMGTLFSSQGFHNTFPLPVAKQHQSLVHMRHHNLGSRNHLWVQLTAFRPTVRFLAVRKRVLIPGRLTTGFNYPPQCCFPLTPIIKAWLCLQFQHHFSPPGEWIIADCKVSSLAYLTARVLSPEARDMEREQEYPLGVIPLKPRQSLCHCPDTYCWLCPAWRERSENLIAKYHQIKNGHTTLDSLLLSKKHSQKSLSTVFYTIVSGSDQV